MCQLRPGAVGCDGEALLAFCEDGLERGEEVLWRDVSCGSLTQCRTSCAWCLTGLAKLGN
jgi:hypothetical protein